MWRRPWRSRRCSKGSRRASSGSGRIRSPILCLWIFIWPTARRFGFSNGFRSRLPSFSRPPTTLEAFKVDSIDYLLKPIKEEEVRRALEKLRRLSGLERSRYSERVERLAERANERQQVFLVRVRDKFIPLQRERIAYCYTSDERVTACTLDGEKYPLDKPLETLQTLLPASDFFRANRQFNRRAAGRRRDRGLVRQPAGVASERRNTRTDRPSPRPGFPNSSVGLRRFTLPISRFTRRFCPLTPLPAPESRSGRYLCSYKSDDEIDCRHSVSGD